MSSSSHLPLRRAALLTLLAAVLFTPLAALAGPRGEFSQEDDRIIRERWPDAAETPSGLRYVIVKPGNGPLALTQQKLTVLYRGTLLDGTEFSAKLDPADPFVFRLGTREVIAAWEEACREMRVGEKRILIVPYALGYGLRGRSPDIPHRATLIFEVELLSAD